MNQSTQFSIVPDRRLRLQTAVWYARLIAPRIVYPLGLERTKNWRANRHNRCAVFIWIPKTAGTSIQDLLEPHGCPKLTDPYAVRHCFSQNGIVNFGHQSYLALVDAGLVSQKFDRAAYKFCFVRNPYDRAVSLFFYLKKRRQLHANLSFRTFTNILRDGAVEEIGVYNVKGLSQCNSQLAWIQDGEGKVFVDFIGRVERIDKDIKELCGNLRIDGDLPHVNSTSHVDYRDYYDDESRRNVAQVYADDIEYFKYVF